MKLRFPLLVICMSLVAVSSFGAVPTADTWKKQIAELSAQPQDLATSLTLAQAKVRLERLQYLIQEDPESPEFSVQWRACSLYVSLAQVQQTTAKLRMHTDSLQIVRLAVQKEIVGFQKQLIDIETGKSTGLAADLDAEKRRLAMASAASADEQLRIQKEAAEREKKLKAELDEKQRLLDEERRKAEERQADARKKLDALQSKLINVHKDARGIILSMSDILFEVNKANLTPDLKTSLAKISGILTVYGESTVIVEGHTDNTGSVELNQKLSEQRAGNVRQFLIEQGITAERLRSEGFGFSKPIADNSTPEGRQKNRRVDLVIQDKNLQ